MKIILGSSCLLLVTLTLFFETGLTSCTKEKIVKDPTLTDAMLIAGPWKTREMRAVFGGDSIYYLQGGTNNTSGFGDRSLESYTFNQDGTGTFIDGAGSPHPIEQWKFENAEKTKLTFFLHATGSISSVAHFVTWENIRLKNGAIYTDEYYFDKYVFKHYHGQAIRYQ